MASIKAKKTFTKMVENGGSVSRAMREAGYSPNTAKVPSKLTKSKGWKELMDQYMPDSLLAEKHHALLSKRDKTGIDTMAVKAGLEMAYKLKGSFAPDRVESTVTVDLETKQKTKNAIKGILN